MVQVDMPSTPPPPSPSALRVPRAPRHGPKHDDYEPYATRSSARLASQRASRADQTTPPLSHSSASTRPATSKRTLSPSSPGTAKSSPKKAARSNKNAVSRNSPFEMELSLPRTSAHHTSRSSAERALPTPAKTPSKKKVISSDTSTSRSLFPPSSTPKRRKMEPSKRPTGVPYGIFVDEPEGAYTLHDAKQELIPIHEDSRDRIPITDRPTTDPFMSKPAAGARRHATRSKTHGNEEGVWYFQRGKRVFRRFDDMEDEGEDEDDLGLFANRPDLLADNPDVLKDVKTLKRSEVKPRVLFPVADESANNEEDVTDVEDNEPTSPTPEEQPPRPSAKVLFRTNLTPPIIHSQPEPNDTFVTPFPLDRPRFSFRKAREHAFLEERGRDQLAQPQPPSTSENVSSTFGDVGSSTFGDVDSSTFGTVSSSTFGFSSGTSIRKYWSPSMKPRETETRADRIKRHREARGSPAPRTRQAKRDEAAAEAAAAQVPTAEVSTADA